MKKLILGFLAIGCFTFFATRAQAQENIFSVGVEVAIPMGDFSDLTNFGIGGALQYELGITGNIALNVGAGAIFYTTDVDGFSFFHVPIQVGARYYLQQQQEGFYIGAKLGTHVAVAKMDEVSVGGVTVMEASTDSDATFSFAPEIGYYLTKNISLGARYQIISGKDGGKSSSYLGIGAMLNF